LCQGCFKLVEKVCDETYGYFLSTSDVATAIIALTAAIVIQNQRIATLEALAAHLLDRI